VTARLQGSSFECSFDSGDLIAITDDDAATLDHCDSIETHSSGQMTAWVVSQDWVYQVRSWEDERGDSGRGRFDV